MQLGRNLREALVLVAAETDHLTLLGHRPAVIVLGVHDAGGVNGALRNSARGTSLHFVVRQCLLSCNRIRFECIKLGWNGVCRKKGLNLRPTAYKAGALPLSYDGRMASTRDRTEVAGWLKGGFPTVKARSPNHWTIEANTSSGIRTHEA